MRDHWLATLAAGGCVALFTALYVPDLSSPLVGMTDVGHYGFVSDYFARHLSFAPWPTLDLQNDELQYPHGSTHVFVHWAIEADYFFALMRGLFGPGAWLQVYFLATLLVTSLGSYALLAREHGRLRAGLFAFAVTYSNFYLLERYPGHYPLSFAHWPILGILVDYRIVRAFARGERVSGSLLAWRAFFAVGALGGDLPYFAGISYVSAILAFGWIGLSSLRRRGWAAPSLPDVALFAAEVVGRFDLRRPGILLPLALTALETFFYLPLALQIVWTSTRFDFAGQPSAPWWSHPLRLLVPVLPGTDLTLGGLEGVFGDETTKVFDFRPGVGLLLLGVAGLFWGGRRRLLPLVPFLALFAMLVSYRQGGFSLLGLFPWMKFARMAARFGIFFPVLFGLFALNLPRVRELGTARRLVLAALVLLFVVETGFAHERMGPGGRGSIRAQLVIVPDLDFMHLMETIRESPGEALFEWPFVLVGGNGVGVRELGAFYGELGSIMQLHQFHRKKTMGGYYSRLHPSQLTAHVEAGWPRLLLPEGVADVFGPARRQHRLSEPQLDFMVRYLQLHDFAGVLLFPDLIHSSNVEAIYARVGRPVAQAAFPGQGRLQFIPKPEAWRDMVDKEAGKALRLQSFVETAGGG